MFNFLTALQHLDNMLSRSIHPIARLCGMLWCMHVLAGNLGEAGYTTQVHNHAQPRPILLTSVYILVTCPWALLWTALAGSFMQQTGSNRVLTIGGTLAGFSGAGILLRAGIPARLDLFSPGQMMHLQFALLLAHAGFGLGYFVSTLLPKPTTSRQKDGVTTESVQDLDARDDRAGDEKPAPLPANHSVSNTAPICLFTMLWLAACTCKTIVEDISSIADFPDRLTQMTLISQAVFYSLVAFFYTRNSVYTGREWALGLLVGGTSLVALRCTSRDVRWQLWMIDSGLAFVCGNAGVAGGCFLHSIVPE